MEPLARRCRNGGVTLRYLAWPAPDASRPPALLVPGMAAPAEVWLEPRGLVDALREDGSRAVLAVSLRGRGGSDCPVSGWTAADHQADLAAVLDAERVARCHVVGHSVGGSHAVGLALDAPDRVASVTVGDFPPVVPEYGEDWVRRLESWGATHFHPDFPRRVALFQRRVDHAPRLTELRAPLLVVKGAHAGSLLPDAQLALFQAAPRVEVVRVAADHDVFSAEEAWRACADFVLRADGVRP